MFQILGTFFSFGFGDENGAFEVCRMNRNIFGQTHYMQTYSPHCVWLCLVPPICLGFPVPRWRQGILQFHGFLPLTTTSPMWSHHTKVMLSCWGHCSDALVGAKLYGWAQFYHRVFPNPRVSPCDVTILAWWWHHHVRHTAHSDITIPHPTPRAIITSFIQHFEKALCDAIIYLHITPKIRLCKALGISPINCYGTGIFCMFLSVPVKKWVLISALEANLSILLLIVAYLIFRF